MLSAPGILASQWLCERQVSRLDVPGVLTWNLTRHYHSILFGLPVNEERLAQVIFTCCLQRDLTIWPHGLDTEIGERGVSAVGAEVNPSNLLSRCYSFWWAKAEGIACPRHIFSGDLSLP